MHLRIGILLTIFCQILPNKGQSLPETTCPQFFEYLSFNQQFIGHISIRHDRQSEVNTLVVEFSQRGAYQWSYVGTLALMDDQETTKYKIQNDQPINYRVDFPIPQMPPKLTQIRLNNDVICSASEYPRPRTAISLMHTLRFPVVSFPFIGASPSPSVPFQPDYQRPPVAQQTNNHRPPVAQQPDYQRPPAAKQPDYQRPPLAQQPDYQTFIIVPPTRTSSVIRPTPPRPPTAQVQTGNEIDPRIAPKPPLVSQTLNNQPLSSICGRERTITTPFIFQGNYLERGQMPWLVGLFDRDLENAYTFFCGGTLISKSTVVTAAHCFLLRGRPDLPAERVVVSLGRNSLDIISDGELRDVSELLIHEAYRQSNYTQPDMALIKLASQVTFTDYIVPICLWNENLPRQLPTGYKSYVAGWGADENRNTNTKLSKITDLDILSEFDCVRELTRNLVNPLTLCAKKKNAGPCTSDGGGGLMLRENNVWVLRGIISASLVANNTCYLKKPSFYTDVAIQISWVRQNMWD